MKILITGATGFLGAVLARKLCEKENVHILTRPKSDCWRLKDISGQITRHDADLRDTEAVEKTINKIKPDGIFHLAAHGGFADQKDKNSIISSNFSGTVNLLRACEKTGFRFFINAGTSSEYGVKNRPMREDDVLHPLGDYAVSKAAATLYCNSEAESKKLPIITLRIFSPFGPWDDPKRMIPYVIKSFLKKSVPRLSSPDFVRDYIFVEDVADAFIRAMRRPLTPGAVINIGSGRQASTAEIVATIGEIIGHAPRPAWREMPPARPEPDSWVADISTARAALDWTPPASSRPGLEKTVNWFRENLAFYP